MYTYGSMPEWLKGADCKSAGLSYVGSNPTRPKNINYKKLYENQNDSNFTVVQVFNKKFHFFKKVSKFKKK